MSYENFENHPELPIREAPSLTIEEIVGERIPTFEDVEAYDLAPEAIEPISYEDEELILERYLELKEQEETLARIRAYLVEAIKTLPQDEPQVFVSDTKPPTTNDVASPTKKEKATLPPSGSETNSLF